MGLRTEELDNRLRRFSRLDPIVGCKDIVRIPIMVIIEKLTSIAGRDGVDSAAVFGTPESYSSDGVDWSGRTRVVLVVFLQPAFPGFIGIPILVHCRFGSSQKANRCLRQRARPGAMSVAGRPAKRAARTCANVNGVAQLYDK